MTAHVALSEASVNKNYNEIKSASESYNPITWKQNRKRNTTSSVSDSVNHAIESEISEKIPVTKLSDFNEVLSESNVELERSYQKKQRNRLGSWFSR